MRKIIKLFYLIVLFIGLSTQLSANDKFFILPNDAPEALEAVLKQIDQSKQSIKITIYNFTHKKIANRLKSAAKRGVKIEIIFDDRSANDKRHSMLYYLAKYNNISVYRIKGKLSKNKKYHGIMHLKSALFDQSTILFGSANWTNSAFGNNYEMIYITKQYALAKKFNRYFEEIKKTSQPFK